MSNVGEKNATNAILQGGEPIMSYRKTILGKVFVNVWDSFSESPEGVLLFGEKDSDTAIYDIWNTRELRYFELRNKKLLETGYIIPHVRKQEEDVAEHNKESLSDEQLTKILNDKFFSLRSFLTDVESVPVIYRLLMLAEDMSKPAKTIDFIKSKLAEVQSFEPAALRQEEE